jgi:glucokinase
MDSGVVLAFDLGGTDLKGALVDTAGAVLASERLPAGAAVSASAPFEAMVALAARLTAAAPAPPRAAGLGAPGVIDPLTGALVGTTAHLPHWRDVPLRDELARRLGLPVVVDNDANLAALAEHRAGAARGARLSLTVTVGTGVGCGIVSEGRVLRGAHGGAGELGHLPLGGTGARCACGVEGCVEPEAAGEGLAAAAREAGLDAPDARAVFALAALGEPRAQALVARLAHQLGRLLGAAVCLLDPDVVVIGGGVAQAGEALLAPVRVSLARHALASHVERVTLVPAALGERAGVVGAGLAAWDAARAASAPGR